MFVCMCLSMLCVYWFVDSTIMVNKDEYYNLLSLLCCVTAIFLKHATMATLLL